ncbi:hypothetical protein ARSEF4850_009537 [Beauveria asiatica]
MSLETINKNNLVKASELAFTDFPMPADYPVHPNPSHVEKYLEAYAQHFGLLQNIKFSSTVLDVCRDEGDKIWLVRVKNTETNETRVEEFDRVVFATGFLNTKNMPSIKGIGTFAGDALHSREFKDPSRYKDKNVLVVDVFPRLANVAFSMVVQKVHESAFPFFKQHVLAPRAFLGTRHHIPVISDDLPSQLHDGDVESKPGIREVTGPHSVDFVDDTSINDLDAIIFCAGYQFDISIIQGAGSPMNPSFAFDGFQGFNKAPFRDPHDSCPRLYRGILSERYPESLAVLGHYFTGKPVFVTYDLATMAVASLWTGSHPLPTKDAIKQEIDAHYKSRAFATWNRFGSEVSSVLLGRFGPDSIQAARHGCASLIADHFNGNARGIPHVDKKANFMRNWDKQIIGRAYYPACSILAVAAYESGPVACAMVLLAWGTAEQAAKLGALAHLTICEDFSGFTAAEAEVRVRMIALAVGAAYQLGDSAAGAVVDSSLLQCSGTGKDKSIESVMAWRAINGGSAPYTGALFGISGAEERLIAPILIMATHDLYDWRSDTAAGNHENGVSGVYGLGIKDPFHAYLEAVLKKAVKYPVPALHAISGVTFLHFTAARHGSYEYRGTHRGPCPECVESLREATKGAGLNWAPKKPPQSFAGGSEMREAAKAFIDSYEDRGILQESASWFQHLILTGKI